MDFGQFENFRLGQSNRHLMLFHLIRQTNDMHG